MKTKENKKCNARDKGVWNFWRTDSEHEPCGTWECKWCGFLYYGERKYLPRKCPNCGVEE